MKVSELIKALQEMPQDLDVCIVDNDLNEHFCDSDGECTEGIYPNISVVTITNYPNFENPLKKDWVAIIADNTKTPELFDQ